MLRNLLITLTYCAAVCFAGMYASGVLAQRMEDLANFFNWR